MGFRFRRSVKILPGVRINFNKNSLSVSVGPKGAKTTIGPNGIRQTVGIPGTGMSYTTTKKYQTSNIEREKALEANSQNTAQLFCTNCGKKLSKDAKFCHMCGKRVAEQSLLMGSSIHSPENDEHIAAHYCPKCHSNNIQFSKQGFSVSKAIVGGILTGGIGVVAGFHGCNKPKGKCLKCGYEWKI